MVLDFFESKPKILEGLMNNKNYSFNSFNAPSISHAQTGYYSMTGMGLWYWLLFTFLFLNSLIDELIFNNKKKA